MLLTIIEVGIIEKIGFRVYSETYENIIFKIIDVSYIRNDVSILMYFVLR